MRRPPSDLTRGHRPAACLPGRSRRWRGGGSLPGRRGATVPAPRFPQPRGRLRHGATAGEAHRTTVPEAPGPGPRPGAPAAGHRSLAADTASRIAGPQQHARGAAAVPDLTRRPSAPPGAGARPSGSIPGRTPPAASPAPATVITTAIGALGSLCERRPPGRHQGPLRALPHPVEVSGPARGRPCPHVHLQVELQRPPPPGLPRRRRVNGNRQALLPRMLTAVPEERLHGRGEDRVGEPPWAPSGPPVRRRAMRAADRPGPRSRSAGAWRASAQRATCSLTRAGSSGWSRKSRRCGSASDWMRSSAVRTSVSAARVTRRTRCG